MAGLLRIEDFLRAGELIDPSAQLLLRGAPLHPEGLLRNADATRRRYTFAGEPLLAISAEVTVDAWDVDAILSGPRLRTRRTYAATTVGAVLDAGFDLLPTFRSPHYSVVLPAYTVVSALALSGVLGDPILNSFYERSEPR